MTVKKARWWRKKVLSLDPDDQFHGGSYDLVLRARTKEEAERKFLLLEEEMVYYYLDEGISGPFPTKRRAEKVP